MFLTEWACKVHSQPRADALCCLLAQVKTNAAVGVACFSAAPLHYNSKYYVLLWEISQAEWGENGGYIVTVQP